MTYGDCQQQGSLYIFDITVTNPIRITQTTTFNKDLYLNIDKRANIIAAIAVLDKANFSVVVELLNPIKKKTIIGR